MTIAHILKLAQKAQLRVEMEVFLAYLLEVDRSQLIAYGEKEVPVEKMAELQKAWTSIQDGMPVAYLTHEKEFYGFPFYVDNSVLVPRPETEHLVDYVLEKAKILRENGVSVVNVLEIGTGCGAIAVSLKKVDPALHVVATEVSSEALEIAKKNAKILDVDLEFVEADLLDGVSDQKFHILVGNLPYIGVSKNNYLSENVERHEPHVALFGGSDGLQLYSKLFEQIVEQDRNIEFIMGEIGFTQGISILELVKQKLPNYSSEVKQDYQKLDRHFVLEKTA